MAVLLYAVRHGETELNKDNRYRGWTDASLDTSGIRQAAQAGKFLADRNIKHIYGHDLKRVKQTTRIIQSKIGDLPTGFDADLRPLDVGDLTGKDKTKNPLDHWLDNRDEPIPGGESVNDFHARMKEILSLYRHIARQRGPILLVLSTSNLVALENIMAHKHKKIEKQHILEPGGVLALDKDDRIRILL